MSKLAVKEVLNKSFWRHLQGSRWSRNPGCESQKPASSLVLKTLDADVRRNEEINRIQCSLKCRPQWSTVAINVTIFLLVTGTMLFLGSSATAAPDGSRWGANYFPNAPLVTQDGKVVNFYDDLIKDKVVAINFMFTSCEEVCPAETARLRQVQTLLGDRLGRDVFMYSISIDPEHDTPAVLKRYAEKFNVGPGWTFLTGKEVDITVLRKKLGLYIDEIQDGSGDHNVSLIIGNEATGQWMKRSPFDNPQVLARLIGDRLHSGKIIKTGAQKSKRSYAEAPRLAEFSRGEYLFRTRCNACHTIGVGDGLGPDLLGVADKRDRIWLTRWLKEPDKMLAEKDPIAIALFAKFNELAMPNLNLNNIDAAALIDYMDVETSRITKAKPSHGDGDGHKHVHVHDG